MKKHNLTIPLALDKERLDKAISKVIKEISRNYVQKAIKHGDVSVNKFVITDLNFKVKFRDDVIILIHKEEKLLEIPPTCINLEILFEDNDLLIINKQAGLTVHPGAGNYRNTLVNGLIYHSKSLSDIGRELFRPGIVHRLDKNTSGLMIVAKNNSAHSKLAYQIKQRSVTRKYKALIWGAINPLSGVIEGNIARSKFDRKKMTIVNIGGKKAITYYKTCVSFCKNLISLLECQLETGRTHQIRTQLNHKGHSVLGDQIYRANNQMVNLCTEELKLKITALQYHCLHAWYISFTHPTTEQYMQFSSDIPNYMKEIILSLSK